MGFLVVLLVIAVLVLWFEFNGLRRRVENADALMASVKEELRELSSRLLRLEHPGIQTTTAPKEVVSIPLPIEAVAPPVAPEPLPPAAVPEHAPAPAPPPVTAPVAPAALPMAPPIARPIPVPVIPVAAAAPVQPAAALPQEKTNWEMEVGTNWLNKIGVLVFIMGVALLVAYSFGRVGPEGRVAIGYALSLGMLATGVVLERRLPYRNYAYGLIAGGWAGTYFTTFAMHEVPAARILDSDLAAVSLLTLVAAGMIGHSLKYRSQVVTGLAFVVAFITLSLSPLSGFAIAASVPLAVALLVVSQRFGWSGVSALGIVSTYGAFAVRHATFPGGPMDGASTVPYVTLATYWLAFEASDIIGLRSRGSDGTAAAAPVPLLALNATGFVGTLLMLIPRDQPEFVAWMLFATAAAYAASAVVRAWLLPGWRDRHSRNQPFDTAHAASAIGAALFAFAIGIQFRGNQLLLARLLEAQLLITSGLLLGDVWLRRFGSIAMALAAVQAWLMTSVVGTGAYSVTWAPGATSVVCLLIAAALYGSRDAIHRRQETPTWLEGGFTWMATILVATVIRFELTPAHQALAGLLFATMLIETARRRTAEYAYQAYVVGAVSALAMAATFVVRAELARLLFPWGPAATDLDVWRVLPAGIAIAAYCAWRLARTSAVPLPFSRTAAGVSLTIATTLLAIFEWRALSADALAPAWALTGLAFVAFGAWRRESIWNSQGMTLALVAAVRVGSALVEQRDPTSAATWGAVAVIVTVYAISYLAARTSISRESRSAALALAAAATGVLTLLEWRLVPDAAFGFALAATGAAAFGVGLWRQAEPARWHGYLLMAGAGLHAAREVLGPAVNRETGTSLWLLGVIALLYVTGLVANHLVLHAADQKKGDRIEEVVPAFLLLGATGLLSVQISRHLRPSMVTLALGAQGLASMLVGLLARARVLRLSGLALLMACILKLFIYDLNELEALARILSFVVLGLILLGISWTYTRYREQIKRLL